MNSGQLLFAGLAGLLLAAGSAQAGEILYENDFESGSLGAEWSSGRTLVREGAFTRFNGRYGNSSTVLTLRAAPPPDGRPFLNFGGAGGFVGGGLIGGDGGDGGDGGGGDGGDGGGGGGDGGGGGGRTRYTLEFDFYAIDSWDGDAAEHGPDRFEVRINNELVFSETFANTHDGQSFRGPDIGPAHIGFNPAWKDSIYRDIAIDFELGEGAEKARIGFYAIGLQGLTDESWGIDNVSVTYDYRSIPAPGTLSAAGLCLLLGARRRR